MSKSNSSTKRILSRCIQILTLLVALILFFIPTFNFYVEVSISETTAEKNQEENQEQIQEEDVAAAKEAGIQLWEMISLSPNSFAVSTSLADESMENMNLYELAGEIIDEGIELMNSAENVEREGDSAGFYVFSIIRIACGIALYFVLAAVAYSLLMSIMALVKIDIGGEKLPFISKSADFMKEGLLIAWFILVIVSLFGGIGLSAVETGSDEVTALVRLVFVKANYLNTYLILACVRIIGWFAFKRRTKKELLELYKKGAE